ncbi:MAG: hypothetical protein KTR25_11970 [Myxococcales bacterium]|nr:hypothetical protein [Myxococcales bacterium]
MRSISIKCAAGLLTISCAGSTPDGLPKPFEPEAIIDKAVLSGPEGLHIRLVQTEQQALIETTRVKNLPDKTVLLADLGGNTSERTYHTQVNGRNIRLLVRKAQDWTLTYHGPIQLQSDPTTTEALRPKELIKEHVKQRAEGRLNRIAAFDRPGEEEKELTRFQSQMEKIRTECGFVPEVAIDFSTFSNNTLIQYSISDYCSSLDDAFRRACKVPELKSYLHKNVSRMVCSLNTEPKIDISPGTITITTSTNTSNLRRWAMDSLDSHAFAKQKTVYQSRTEHNTVVCTSSKHDKAVVVGPSYDERSGGVAYGSRKRLIKLPELRMLGQEWFFEPRYPKLTRNENFRGYDMRYHSYIEVDTDSKDICTLYCGTRNIKLQPLVGSKRRMFLDNAQWVVAPDRREAYALARDKRGTYYYVDRGAQTETARDFRLYIGPQGNLKRQKMKDIVSDSEGEIFASNRGHLKLFIGKKAAEWQRGRRVRKLTRVSIRDNLDLIYNRLGVYLGKPLYTPCDVF